MAAGAPPSRRRAYPAIRPSASAMRNTDNASVSSAAWISGLKEALRYAAMSSGVLSGPKASENVSAPSRARSSASSSVPRRTRIVGGMGLTGRGLVYGRLAASLGQVFVGPFRGSSTGRGRKRHRQLRSRGATDVHKVSEASRFHHEEFP